MNNKVIIFIGCISILLFGSGCSTIGIGHNETYCQEYGSNYEDAGVCGNSYDIYKDWHITKKEAYKNFKKGNSND